MKLFVIAARDNAVQAYMQPSFVTHTGAAVRAFSDHCKDSSSDFAKHPEDFDLYLLGEFDDSSGEFINTPERLARAVDFIVSK